MARKTGKAGAATIGGNVWIVTDWSYEEESKMVDLVAMGDLWTEREHLHSEWTAEIEGFLSSGKPYTNAVIPTGATSAVVLKFDTADTNPFMTDTTGKVRRARVEANVEQGVKIRATIVGVVGATGPTISATG